MAMKHNETWPVKKENQCQLVVFLHWPCSTATSYETE